MPAYNFQQRFAEAVQTGRKRQTIRETDKGAKAGDIAYLFTGMRTKQCKRLGFARIFEVSQILLSCDYKHGPLAIIKHQRQRNEHLSGSALDEFARSDGFQNGDELIDWFQQTYGSIEFKGYLHRWACPVSTLAELQR